ncbi:MAG: hypothetical protein HY080_04215 [Gammaproteobacteria bacterium]|nr:hypothetical protein [Gammaproteobacteria bacterium]
MQTRNRFGEGGSVPFRTGRFYSVDGDWWFAIRRGPDQGPYLSKPAAKKALIEFLNDQFTFEKIFNQDKLKLA